MEQQQEQKETSRPSGFLSSLGIVEHKSKMMLFALLLLVLSSAIISFCLMAPFGAPSDVTVDIKKGAYLTEVSSMLYDANLIRSRVAFETCAKIVGGEKPVVASSYLFKEPLSACGIALRIAQGISGKPPVRVTVPEGMSNQEMAIVLAKAFPEFNRNAFFEEFSSDEGFLFPDTYFFSEDTTIDTVGKTMLANFNKRITPLLDDIIASGRPLRDVVIMASIIEKEALTEEDKALVSGILWKRIEKGMPLQVDATFMYLLGKKSSELTLGDLQMKSAYNTYQNKGLPVGPIGNPGVSALNAAIHPTSSPYLYYLSDNDGVMHYAKTFEEHKANKAKYLR
ncbi:MAG: endolytic transglycosylase MltG [Candidatus Pacebacteria bacterium]|jgi:UPF0755 protein|nr:endolytic transglycosylase MltG [Candidatus Paceibacterota bacterium]